VVAVSIAVLAPTPGTGGAPAKASSADPTVRWSTDKCREAALFATTRYASIAPLVPALFRDDVIRLGPPSARLATLIFTFNRCASHTVTSPLGVYTAPEAAEMIVGVMLSSEESPQAVQFYTLASYVDWDRLADAYRPIGLPTTHVPGMRIEFLSSPPAPQIGKLHARIPAPGDLITAQGDFQSLNPAPIDAHASQFALGPHGAVIVDHHAPIFRITPGATATITTGNPDGITARAIGARSTTAAGLFFDKGPGHAHTATLLGPETTPAAWPSALPAAIFECTLKAAHAARHAVAVALARP
jgi:hypothetical protein